MFMNKSWIFNMPPGWGIMGKVVGETEGFLQLVDALYIENVNPGHHALSANPARSLSTTWPLPDGHVISKDLIIQAAPLTDDAHREMVKRSVKGQIK